MPRNPKRDATEAYYTSVLMDFYKTEMSQNSILRISDDKTLRLIELYERERCLWDTTHKEYRSRQKRALAAERIARKLNLRHFEAKHVLIKFKNLRNSYCQELKKMAFSLHSGAPDEDVYKPRVFWFNKMDSFLRPHLQPNPGSSHMLSLLQYPMDDEERMNQILSKAADQKGTLNMEETALIESFETDPERDPTEWPAETREPVEWGADMPEPEEVLNARSDEETSDDEPLVKKRKKTAYKKSVKRRKDSPTDQILRKVAGCLEVLSDRQDDMFDQFGKYVAALLRAMPGGHARALQPRVVALLTADNGDSAPCTTVSQSDQNI